MSKFFPFMIFLFVFLSIYGFLHYYFYRTLKKAAILGTSCSVPVIIILVLLFISPVLSRFLSRTESTALITVLDYIAYIWMVMLFLFFSIHILIDIYGLIIRLQTGFLSQGLLKFIPGNAKSFLATIVMIFAIVCYGSFEARDIRVERIVLETDKLPHDVERLVIVQISDTHFSSINSVGLAEKIARIVNGLNPDILLSTGDIIERGMKEKARIAEIFREIRTVYGKFAVMGNHEFFTGESESTSFLDNAGFRMLRNEGTTVEGFLNVVGVDDPAGKRTGVYHDMIQENDLLMRFHGKNLTILLKHQPVIEDGNQGYFDLQLSGHTHNGQIFPFSLVVSIFYRYMKGLHKVGEDTFLYVSSGTGTWGPPIRFLAPPEISVIEYQRKT
ncbi:MAG: metallophosphoesterase [Deltaproteobacteria bacterium]|nr:metallophosphoesterase [Deltaproteobacteria bacterium]